MDTQSLIYQYLDKIKNFQEILIQYLEKEGVSEEDFQKLNSYIDENKIKQDRYDLKQILHLLMHVSNNHRRNADFFNKIERVISIFKDNIAEFYTTEDLFNVFKNNKRMLLFLYKEEIIPPESSMVSIITNFKFKEWYYPHYFLPEFKSIFNVQTKKEIEQANQKMNESQDKSLDLFEKNRQIGENETELCQLIRNDSLDEFISYVKESNVDLNQQIKPSIFETNSFLLKRKPTIIEYAAFFGSINIFKHLQSNQVELTPSLWMYAIHGQNIDLLKLLIENKIKPQDESYRQCYLEAIKCHHIELSEYIETDLLKKKKADFSPFVKSLQVYNIKCLPKMMDTEFNIFYDFCQYDYFYIVSLLLKDTQIDLNARRIFIKFL